MARRIISLIVILSFLFTQTGFAQAAAVELNLSGYFAKMASNFTPIDSFRPLHLRYFSYDTLNNSFKILLDKGDQFKQGLSPSKLPQGALKGTVPEDKLKEETKELLKYFLIGVTLPNDTFWVNLRPDSPSQIIDSVLEETDIGKIMLEADLQLKKDTANYTSPQTPEGREYWDRLYKKAEELYGYQTVEIPTLTRPWIVPGEIIVRETTAEPQASGRTLQAQPSAYIYKATLKVMLESDYLRDCPRQGSSEANQRGLSLQEYSFKDERSKALNEYSTQLIRELIIPKLTKEVNTSKRYAALRQVYYSLILSRWFKSRFKDKGTVPAIANTGSTKGTVPNFVGLIDKSNLTNLTSKTDWSKTTYFNAYKKSFAEGEYNIKEPVYTPTGQTIRSYMSGGIAFPNIASSGINGSQLPSLIVPLKDNLGLIEVDSRQLSASPLTEKDIYNETVRSGLKALLKLTLIHLTSAVDAGEKGLLDNQELSSYIQILVESLRNYDKDSREYIAGLDPLFNDLWQEQMRRILSEAPALCSRTVTAFIEEKGISKLLDEIRRLNHNRTIEDDLVVDPIIKRFDVDKYLKIVWQSESSEGAASPAGASSAVGKYISLRLSSHQMNKQEERLAGYLREKGITVNHILDRKSKNFRECVGCGFSIGNKKIKFADTERSASLWLLKSGGIVISFSRYVPPDCAIIIYPGKDDIVPQKEIIVKMDPNAIAGLDLNKFADNLVDALIGNGASSAVEQRLVDAVREALSDNEYPPEVADIVLKWLQPPNISLTPQEIVISIQAICSFIREEQTGWLDDLMHAMQLDGKEPKHLTWLITRDIEDTVLYRGIEDEDKAAAIGKNMYNCLVELIKKHNFLLHYFWGLAEDLEEAVVKFDRSAASPAGASSAVERLSPVQLRDKLRKIEESFSKGLAPRTYMAARKFIFEKFLKGLDSEDIRIINGAITLHLPYPVNGRFISIDWDMINKITRPVAVRASVQPAKTVGRQGHIYPIQPQPIKDIELLGEIYELADYFRPGWEYGDADGDRRYYLDNLHPQVQAYIQVAIAKKGGLRLNILWGKVRELEEHIIATIGKPDSVIEETEQLKAWLAERRTLGARHQYTEKSRLTDFVCEDVARDLGLRRKRHSDNIKQRRYEDLLLRINTTIVQLSPIWKDASNQFREYLAKNWPFLWQERDFEAKFDSASRAIEEILKEMDDYYTKYFKNKKQELQNYINAGTARAYLREGILGQLNKAIKSLASFRKQVLEEYDGKAYRSFLAVFNNPKHKVELLIEELEGFDKTFQEKPRQVTARPAAQKPIPLPPPEQRVSQLRVPAVHQEPTRAPLGGRQELDPPWKELDVDRVLQEWIRNLPIDLRDALDGALKYELGQLTWERKAVAKIRALRSFVQWKNRELKAAGFEEIPCYDFDINYLGIIVRSSQRKEYYPIVKISEPVRTYIINKDWPFKVELQKRLDSRMPEDGFSTVREGIQAYLEVLKSVDIGRGYALDQQGEIVFAELTPDANNIKLTDEVKKWVDSFSEPLKKKLEKIYLLAFDSVKQEISQDVSVKWRVTPETVAYMRALKKLNEVEGLGMFFMYTPDGSISLRPTSDDCSSPLNQKNPTRANSPMVAPGGIDFKGRAMASATTYETFGSFAGLDFNLPVLSASAIASFNLDKEEIEITRLVNNQILPSGQRIKEFMAASAAKGEFGQRRETVIAWLAKMGIMEESMCCTEESSKEYREALVIADSYVVI